MKPTTKTELSENAFIVFHALKQDGKQTQRQISEKVLLPVRTVQRAITELREKQWIKREGSDKKGEYTILKRI